MTALIIRDTQIAIKQYQSSLTLEGLSIENGQPSLLKSFISQLTNYFDEILELPEVTLLTELPTTYRAIVFNIQPYLSQVELPVEVKDLSIKPIDPLSIVKFRFIIMDSDVYNFDLKTMPEPLRDKLKVSQRVNIYSKNDNYLDTGIISNLTKTQFSVSTKYALGVSPDNIGYGIVDNFWGSKDYSCTWESDVCFEESQMPCWIHVKLYSVKYLYNCAWSLYYAEDEFKDLILVAKGTDNVQPGYAYLSKSNYIFKPGIYTMKSRIIKYGVYSTNAKQIKWKLLSSNNFIKND